VQRSPSLLRAPNNVADKRSFRHSCTREKDPTRAGRNGGALGAPPPAGIWAAFAELPVPGGLALAIRCSDRVDGSRSWLASSSRHQRPLLPWWAGLPARAAAAFPPRALHLSEFRYCPTPLMAHTLTIRGHPSQEKTADTLARSADGARIDAP